MSIVTKRKTFAFFAQTKDVCFVSSFEFYRLELCSLVRIIAERLSLRQPAAAERILFSWLQLYAIYIIGIHVGARSYHIGLCHIFFFLHVVWIVVDECFLLFAGTVAHFYAETVFLNNI
jgi:hypothetical protein